MKAYLKDQDLIKKSKYHTAYVGDGAVADGGKTRTYSLTFVNGVALNVDPQVFQRFKDAGVCADKPPSVVLA